MRNRTKTTMNAMETTSNRLPPHSAGAEEAVLGAILTDPSTCTDLAIEYGVTHDWFYDLRNRQIWITMAKMYAHNVFIDLITLSEHLTHESQLEAVGGLQRIMGLPDKCPSTAGMTYHLDIIKEKYMARKAIQLMSESINDLMGGADSPSNLILKAEHGLFEMISASEGTTLRGLKAITLDVIDVLERRHEGGTGLKTGYPDLDRATCGMGDGEMWVLAGRPSTGKTSLSVGVSLNVASTLAAENKSGSVLIFSLEMDANSIDERMLSSGAMVDTHRMDMLSEGEKLRLSNSAGKLAMLDGRIIIDDTPSLTITKLVARARRHAKKSNVKLIVIDYLQLINSESEKSFSSRREAVDAISRGIKGLARELKVPVLALAQLNREFEKEKGRAPRMSDLRESGQIEQDADFVGMLYELNAKEDGASAGPVASKEVRLRIVKQRNGSKDIDIPFLFRPPFTRFDSVAKIDDKDIPR